MESVSNVLIYCTIEPDFTIFWLGHVDFQSPEGDPTQCDVGPFNCINEIMKEMGERVWRMMSAEAVHAQTTGSHADKDEDTFAVS
jgi:hypothetical protein